MKRYVPTSCAAATALDACSMRPISAKISGA